MNKKPYTRRKLIRDALSLAENDEEIFVISDDKTEVIILFVKNKNSKYKDFHKLFLLSFGNLKENFKSNYIDFISLVLMQVFVSKDIYIYFEKYCLNTFINNLY